MALRRVRWLASCSTETEVGDRRSEARDRSDFGGDRNDRRELRRASAIRSYLINFFM
ncbi:hypothetical protein [Telmatospirillum sp.]|uniref:hypothetical protein n=1 Tax=Telmatospirillum sp. TaxID=2079197 RepID=UPI002849E9E5|nr:hypothetical protein [Telmatospirillum sp.]MDR3437636.1 hypothetical protein [Telmatospirillum sp.]